MKLASLVLAALAVSAPGHADAKCGTPSWIGTPHSAKIPAHGSLYLYSEALAYREHSRVGGPITAETKVSDTVMRLDYASKADELELDPDSTEPHVYTIDSGWRAPQAAPRVLQYWHHVYEWTCSSADSLMIQIDQPTAAFRVHWKAIGGVAHDWVIPARTGDNNVNVLELGKINCGSTTLDPEELARGGELTLIAIRYDGSEVAVTGVPKLLVTAKMPTSSDGIDRAIAYEPGAEPIKPTPLPHDDSDSDFSLHLFGIVLAVFAVLLVVRFRHRALKSVV